MCSCPPAQVELESSNPALTLSHRARHDSGAAVIPPFHAALDRCLSYLEPRNGLLGVADFYVSAKHDLPLRQQPWARRFFWQATFDTDGISIGPERRAYLDNRLSRLWEMNSQVSWILRFQEHLALPW